MLKITHSVSRHLSRSYSSASIKDVLSKSSNLIDKGKLQEAMSVLNSADISIRNNPSLKILKGSINAVQGKRDLASQEFNEAEMALETSGQFSFKKELIAQRVALGV